MSGGSSQPSGVDDVRTRELRDAVKEAASTVAAGRAPSFDYTLGRLLDAQAATWPKRRLVFQKHKPLPARAFVPAS